jgi:starch phosphorylase
MTEPILAYEPRGLEGFDDLVELALDLRWSWNHRADELWQQLDPALWELTHNPWAVLQTVARARLERLSADPVFRKRVADLIQARRQEALAPTWFQQDHSQAHMNCVAYFSMEFMLSEALPIYSGGLGNVAGDQLKSASDLGVPVIGVGCSTSKAISGK